MDSNNLKEIQLKSNKMISKVHFKEKCSWISNKNSIPLNDKETIEEVSYKTKEEYLNIIKDELELIFSSTEFTKREKKKVYELANEAYWRFKLTSSKK